MPAHPNDPDPFHALRVATWNLASCRRGYRAVSRVVRSLDSDLLAVQEVDRGTTRCGGIDQVQALARDAGYPHFQFFRATSMHGGDYGLGLLSRWPIVGARIGILPTVLGFERRILASAVIELPNAQLAVHVTHLSRLTTRWRLREKQARRIVAQLSPASLPTLLCGDFNDSPGSPAHKILSRSLVDVFRAVGVGRGATFTLPVLRDVCLDYLFASRHVQLDRAEVVSTRASDHFPLSASIRIPALAPGGVLAAAR